VFCAIYQFFERGAAFEINNEARFGLHIKCRGGDTAPELTLPYNFVAYFPIPLFIEILAIISVIKYKHGGTDTMLHNH
jgi:hypothetical protein